MDPTVAAALIAGGFGLVNNQQGRRAQAGLTGKEHELNWQWASTHNAADRLSTDFDWFGGPAQWGTDKDGKRVKMVAAQQGQRAIHEDQQNMNLDFTNRAQLQSNRNTRSHAIGMNEINRSHARSMIPINAEGTGANTTAAENAKFDVGESKGLTAQEIAGGGGSGIGAGGGGGSVQSAPFGNGPSIDQNKSRAAQSSIAQASRSDALAQTGLQVGAQLKMQENELNFKREALDLDRDRLQLDRERQNEVIRVNGYNEELVRTQIGKFEQEVQNLETQRRKTVIDSLKSVAETDMLNERIPYAAWKEKYGPMVSPVMQMANNIGIGENAVSTILLSVPGIGAIAKGGMHLFRFLRETRKLKTGKHTYERTIQTGDRGYTETTKELNSAPALSPRGKLW